MKEFLKFFAWFLASGLILLSIIALISFIIDCFSDEKNKLNRRNDMIDFDLLRLKEDILNLQADMVNIKEQLVAANAVLAEKENNE